MRSAAAHRVPRAAEKVVDEVFDEKQLYAGDVVGEDDDDAQVPLQGAPGFPSIKRVVSHRSSRAGCAVDSPSSAAPSGRNTTHATTPTSTVSGNGTVSRRRKRNTERSSQIVFWLETKYDILHEVCSSFANWKESPSASYDYDLLWSDTAIPADRFMKLKAYQKMNHFVGMSSITRKNNLGRNLLRMHKQLPGEYKFFPDTWILPTDLSDFKQQFTPAKNKTFIVKPDNGCQGKGIFLVRDVDKVPVDFTTSYIAQRYVHRPFLLDGFKFDIRLYVLVVGCDPLRIFLHKRALVRLASEAYVEPTMKNLSQTMVHLTNYAVNKMNPNFEENTNPEDGQDGHKRSWEAVHELLRKDGHDIDTLHAEIEDLVIKTLIAVQPSLSHFYHSCQPDDVENAMAFEILGFDVILDHKLQPWLLEVNHAPSFAAESELDRVVKSEVLRDTFILLNLEPESRRQKKREAREKMDQRAMGVAKKQSMEERSVQVHAIAQERTEWEDAHCNGYKRLYPSPQKERDYMHVHETAVTIWEMLMGGNSRRSVRITQPPEEESRTDGDAHERKESRPKKGASSDKNAPEAEKSPPEPLKRTAEEIREVVERLMNGCSARPRASGGYRRGRFKDAQLANANVEFDSSAVATVAAGEEESQQQQETQQQLQQEQEQKKQGTIQKPGSRSVQVGDCVKVQTSIGWEPVIVRAKRPNGKVDIQFMDGEFMRSVLPRVMRDANGVPCPCNPSAQASAVAAGANEAAAAVAVAAATVAATAPMSSPTHSTAPKLTEVGVTPTPGRNGEVTKDAVASLPVAGVVASGVDASSASVLANADVPLRPVVAPSGAPCGGGSGMTHFSGNRPMASHSTVALSPCYATPVAPASLCEPPRSGGSGSGGVRDGSTTGSCLASPSAPPPPPVLPSGLPPLPSNAANQAGINDGVSRAGTKGPVVQSPAPRSSMTTSASSPGRPPGATHTGGPSHATIEEALASLDRHLSSTIRARRTRGVTCAVGSGAGGSANNTTEVRPIATRTVSMKGSVHCAVVGQRSPRPDSRNRVRRHTFGEK
eukprot:TRINITY_DN26084_c0_g1_i1.p1 TRINITY_DN26084_c0_g1~~TRINITY_DN26084_c0_g1_i1.p1  ORF type:complete len:1050 (-),score=183.36 TRINITY_DN26084_c0_g1_i1:208-3357(-)